MTGKEFFDTHAGNKEKVAELCKHPMTTRLAWELEPVSTLSPGVVGDDETVVRAALNPIHMDGKVIKPAFFSDVATHGLSVHRLAYLDMDAILSIHRSRVESFNVCKTPEKPERSLAGYVPLLVSDVREILHQQERGFGVYDTAMNTDISHAEVCQVITGEHTKRSIRLALYNLGKAAFVDIQPLLGT